MKHVARLAVLVLLIASCVVAYSQQSGPASAPAPAAAKEDKSPAAAAPKTSKPAPAKKKEARGADDVVPPDVKTREDFMRDAPDLPARGGVAYVGRVIFSLFLVAGLIVVTVYVLRALYARGMRLDLKSRHIKVLDVVNLGTNRALFMVRVGDKVLLLGTADKGLAYLADVTESVHLDEEDAVPAGGAVPLEGAFGFRKHLNDALGILRPPGGKPGGQAQFNTRLKERLGKLEEDEKPKE